MKRLLFYACGFRKPAMTLMIALLTIATTAQDRWNFEFRPSVNFATKKLGDADLKTGFGFEGTLGYRILPHLGVYAGWSWNKFASDNSFGGSSVDFEETGYTYGLQFIHPLGASATHLLLRAGALSNHIEMENESGDVIADSGHGFGWQAEAGLSVALSEKWRVLPSIRYRSLSRDLEIGTTTNAADLNYLSIGIGLSRLF